MKCLIKSIKKIYSWYIKINNNSEKYTNDSKKKIAYSSGFACPLCLLRVDRGGFKVREWSGAARGRWTGEGSEGKKGAGVADRKSLRYSMFFLKSFV